MTRDEARTYISAALGHNESTEWLLDYLEDTWESLNALTEHFGSSQARTLLLASACVTFPDGFPGQAYDRTNEQEDLHRLQGRIKEPEQPSCNGAIRFP